MVASGPKQIGFVRGESRFNAQGHIARITLNARSEWHQLIVDWRRCGCGK